MSYFLKIIKGTPFWVWGVLIYLLFVGIKSTKLNIVSLPKLFMTPCVLLAVRYKAFFSGGGLTFFLAILLGTIVSFFIHANHKVKMIKQTQSIAVPGNYTTIIILLAFFIVKYYFGYLKVEDPELAFQYFVIENILSGLFSGHFIGRAIGYAYKYLKD